MFYICSNYVPALFDMVNRETINAFFLARLPAWVRNGGAKEECFVGVNFEMTKNDE
jgi:hypothetical protein